MKSFNDYNLIAWSVMVGIVLLLSLSIEANGAYTFFGLSVWVGVCIIIALAEIYIALIDKRHKWIILLLASATIMFSSLDMFTHYINSKGANEDVVFKVQETDRRIEEIIKELKELEKSEKRLIPEYGSATKREIARKELITRRDDLNNRMEDLSKSKIDLLKKTSFNIPFNAIKLIIIALVQIILIYLLMNPPIRKRVVKSNITNGEIDTIKKVMAKGELDTSKKYLYNRGEESELFDLLLTLNLVFTYKGKYYTYSQDIEKLQKR